MLTLIGRRAASYKILYHPCALLNRNSSRRVQLNRSTVWEIKVVALTVTTTGQRSDQCCIPFPLDTSACLLPPLFARACAHNRLPDICLFYPDNSTLSFPRTRFPAGEHVAIRGACSQRGGGVLGEAARGFPAPASPGGRASRWGRWQR